VSADAKFRLHPAVAVLVAYAAGIIVGNVLWLPYTGALAVAFIPGGLILALPLLAIAMLSATLARRQIEKRPALWCALGAALVVAVWAVFDNPINRAAIERLALAATCAIVAALAFYWLSGPSRRLG
jgi:hypothetical protein